MANPNHWTILPKGMTHDFISIDGDYDFPFYISEKEEWVNYKYLEKNKGKVIISEPCLIMELHRLVPYLENGSVKFHPLNMPYIKIGKIEIVGFVLNILEDEKYYEYQVDDGTGIISIFYDKTRFNLNSRKRWNIDYKYKKYATNINIKLLDKQKYPLKFPSPRPNFNYSPSRSEHEKAVSEKKFFLYILYKKNGTIYFLQLLEHRWSLETNNGLLGKEVARYDYVYAVGYCTLDFCYQKKSRKEITFEDLSSTKLTFYATKVTCISEFEYNAKLQSWLHTIIQKRYNETLNCSQISK
nr:PREDICTED: uncharacterized protein LOC105663083 isoform X1 [Megachile rotundata]